MNGTIEAKGLSGLSDQLQQEFLAAKKAMVYQRQMEDANLSELCNQLAQKHRRRYDRMLDYLANHQ